MSNGSTVILSVRIHAEYCLTIQNMHLGCYIVNHTLLQNCCIMINKCLSFLLGNGCKRVSGSQLVKNSDKQERVLTLNLNPDYLRCWSLVTPYYSIIHVETVTVLTKEHDKNLPGRL